MIMKKFLFILICILLIIMSAGCSSDESDNQPCFDGTIVKELTDGRICVWLGENPDKTLSDFSLCYVAFQKSNLPYKEYIEGNHIYFKIKKYGEAYEDSKEGFYPTWGIFIRYNCIVEPCD